MVGQRDRDNRSGRRGVDGILDHVAQRKSQMHGVGRRAAGGMDRQTLRDWVHRYNAEGLGGLRDRPLPGRQPLLRAEQMQELATIVEIGPDPVADGVVRWRRIDLCAVVEGRFGIQLAVRTMGEILRRLGFTPACLRARATRRATPRPRAYISVWPAPSARGF